MTAITSRTPSSRTLGKPSWIRRSAKAHRVGRWGEDLVAQILSVNGYRILERNWRPPAGLDIPLRGELDLLSKLKLDPQKSTGILLKLSMVIRLNAHVNSLYYGVVYARTLILDIFVLMLLR